MMTRRQHVRSAVAATLFGSIIGASLGCAGYRLGTQTLYRRDIHTVYVPVFESDSFRSQLGERLTEAVACDGAPLSCDVVLTGSIEERT